MGLIERAESVIHKHDREAFVALLDDCRKAFNPEGMLAAQQLFELSHFGEHREHDEVELKIPAATCLMQWSEKGFDALKDSTLRTPKYSNLLSAVAVLASLAAGGTTDMAGDELIEGGAKNFLKHLALSRSEIRDMAKERLTDLILSFESEDVMMAAVSNSLAAAGMFDLEAAKQLFKGVTARWIAVSPLLIHRFRGMLETERDNEPALHQFLEEHPQILDPMALEVWTQPNLHGAKEPDFIIRRADNTYMVVEIETPGKRIMTSANQPSADTTHAVTQVVAYKRHLMDRIGGVKNTFEGFTDPECLVVIGMERDLTPEQAKALLADNQSRYGLRIVGFDWLIDRAFTVSANMVKPSIRVRKKARIN
jgi:Domain of unknown function (DUF4263)